MRAPAATWSAGLVLTAQAVRTVVGGLVVAVVTAERLVVIVDDSNVDDELLELLLLLLLAVVLVDDELLDDEVDELEVTWSAWARDRLRAADAPEAGTSSESTATAKATRATARVRRRSCEASFTSSSASGFTGREWADSRRTRTPPTPRTFGCPKAGAC
jgi:hypothetical protein